MAETNARERRALAAERVRALPRDEAAACYEREYFPTALAVMREEAATATEAGALVLTAGTQPWSTALSLVRHPAREVHGIVSAESRPHFRRAVALAGVPPERVREHEVGKAASVAVYQVVKRLAAALGQDIVVDFTSGTKAMTAGLSSVSGYLRLPQYYLESTHLAHGLFGLEIVHQVEHPLVVLGDLASDQAVADFDRGAWEVAERGFADLVRAGVGGFRFDVRRDLARAYRAWDELRFGDAPSRRWTPRSTRSSGRLRRPTRKRAFWARRSACVANDRRQRCSKR